MAGLRFALALAAAALSTAAAASSSCVTPDSSTPITTCYFDLTAAPSSTQTPASTVLNGGLFRVPAFGDELGNGFIVGTGVFQPFLRIREQANGNADGVEAGFNTDATGRHLDNHDRGATNWNHSIKLSDLPLVTVCDGGGSSGSNCRQYYEFLLDINEQATSSNAGLSLDEFKVYVAGAGNLSATSASGGCAADGTNGGSFRLCNATEVYDMDQVPGGDASILMDYRNYSGSGNGLDLQALVPVANFAGATADSFIYLYSKFGATGTKCQSPAGADHPCQTPGGPLASATGALNFAADAGFEEWSVRKAGRVGLPSSLIVLALGLLLLVPARRSATH
ncbi:MAG: hypothetical protein ACT4P4_07740 [Betaproteobacteria bacterium]